VNPVVLHEDGTDCRHAGKPRLDADPGPLCPAGILVTHIRFNGRVLTLEEARVAFQGFVDAFNDAFAPLVRQLATMAQAVGAAIVRQPGAQP
jgi:hypothetical protein